MEGVFDYSYFLFLLLSALEVVSVLLLNIKQRNLYAHESINLEISCDINDLCKDVAIFPALSRDAKG